MKRGNDDRTTAANDLKAAIRQFTAGMAPGKEGPFYEGQNFTAVDIAAAPWLAARLFVLNKFRGFLVPRTAEFDRFHQWQDAVLRRPVRFGLMWKCLRSFLAVALLILRLMLLIAPFARFTLHHCH